MVMMMSRQGQQRKQLPGLDDLDFGELYYVKMGEIVFTKEPERYHLLGLGTCLGVYIFDLQKKQYTMAHTMLPSKDPELNNPRHDKHPGKFTDAAIINMIDLLIKNGSLKTNIQARVVGGAQIYNDTFNIGERNWIVAKKHLDEQNIPILASDIGGNKGRSIVRFLSTGKMIMRKEGKEFTI